ncbi:MAG: Mut7-C ubiquitin/RNAse domain-containing protein [Bacteroidales bacterium]|nr:Mut7-C ubiquitin/RNAse domain-containing protein [Bacteroidales bacterium]
MEHTIFCFIFITSEIMPGKIHIRFYEELNDFLPPKKRKVRFVYSFQGNQSIKDIIEAIGIPHTEIDLILVEGNSVTFSYKPADGELVSVYPVFESFDIGKINLLRPEPLRKTSFILDVHLGKLARYLRMLGFDTLYQNDYEDVEIINIALAEKRIILTRDLGILKNSKVTHGYFLRSDNPLQQIREIIDRFDLKKKARPVSRCLECNGEISVVDKDDVVHLLLPKTIKYFTRFYQCESCEKLYWEGSHYKRMKAKLNEILQKQEIEKPKRQVK